MVSTSSDGQSRQLFQEHSSPDSPPVGSVIEITTRLDPLSVQHVILWRDIVNVFSNARYVSHDRTVVSFLTDDGLNEREPKMILYHPGVTLRVIVDLGAGQSPTSIKSGFSLASSAVIPSVSTAQEQFSQSAAEDDIETSSIVTAKHSPRILARVRARSYSLLHHKRHSSSKEPHSAPHAAESTDIQYERLVREKFELQRQLSENRRQAQEGESQIRRESQELKEEMRTMRIQQQQLLDNVVNTGNRIESLITQTYELHENPVPRLFIILPKDERKRDFARNLVSKTFRLHFLCECGAHTGYEDGSPHKIHLASHDGYDIVQQSEFIKKYGPYLLVTLQMVRLSLIAAEAAVPALQHFKAVQGLDRIGEFLNITKKTIGGLLDESISFLTSQSGNRRDRADVHRGPEDLDELSGPKGPQLRELESFLSLNDRSRVLGNLYRITTKSGHVKWVCKYHYKRLFQSSPIEELQAFTRNINGTFVEEEGMVTVRLDSEDRAVAFYRVMARAKCVHELRVMLDWTVTRDHLLDLCEAVTDSNIVRLELSGCGKADGTSKIDGTLFRPLLDLMSNGKIQAMILERVYHRDFLYVDESKMGAATRLRELAFNDLSTLDDGRIPTLPRILEFCPSLTSLSIKSEFAHDILSLIRRNPSRFSRLKTLIAHETGRCHYHLVVGLSKGQIEFIEVMRLSSGSWDADGIYELLSCGHITKLRVLLDGADAHGEHCMEILRCNPNVDEFHLSIPELSASAVDWAILSMRESHARQQLIPQNQIKINCDTYPDVVSCTLNFNKDSQAVDVSTHIQLIPEKCNMDNLVALMGKYGWSVTRLDFQNHFSREFALALDNSVRKQGFSSLKRLLLDPARLASLEDFACIDRIIEQSKHLTTFNAVFHMDDRNWITGANWLFAAYRDILTGLTLEGAKGFIWNKELAKLFPSRSELKNLEVLSLKRVDTAKDVEPFVKWIAEMTSKPTPRRTLLKMFTRGRSTTSGSDSNERTHLKQIELDSITLDKGRWETIFKSLDCTALEKLTLMDNKLTSKQLEHLIKRIVSFADGEAVVPLRELNIGSHVDGGLWRLSDRVEKLLRKKAPQIELYKK